MVVLRYIDDFLEESDVEKYCEYIEKQKVKQSIIKDEKMTSEFWMKYGEKIGGTEIIPYVTITNSTHPVGRHRDMRHGGTEKYKLLIYLNNVENGGTMFYIKEERGEKVQVVKNKRNRLVIFDMDLDHESEKFGKRTVGGVITMKKAIGFRLMDLKKTDDLE